MHGLAARVSAQDYICLYWMGLPGFNPFVAEIRSGEVCLQKKAKQIRCQSNSMQNTEHRNNTWSQPEVKSSPFHSFEFISCPV